MVDELLFFSPYGMWKVWKNLCNLHHFDSETSHHFKVTFHSLSGMSHSSKNAVVWYPNKFKIIMVYKDEMYTIILHQKEQ